MIFKKNCFRRNEFKIPRLTASTPEMFWKMYLYPPFSLFSLSQFEYKHTFLQTGYIEKLIEKKIYETKINHKIVKVLHSRGEPSPNPQDVNLYLFLPNANEGA